RGRILAQVDRVGSLYGIERWWQRLRRGRLTTRRDRYIDIAEIDSSVARHQQLKQHRGNESKRVKLPVLLEELQRFRGARRNLIEPAEHALVVQRLKALLGELRLARIAEEFVIAE